MKNDIKQDKAMAKKAVGMHEKQLHGGKKSNLAALKKGGKVKKYEEGGSVKDVPEDDKPPVDKKGKCSASGLSLKYGGSRLEIAALFCLKSLLSSAICVAN
jgi:hypothetical protein